MQITISTSFNKTQVDFCVLECLKITQHNFMTPSQKKCLNRCTKSWDRAINSSLNSSSSSIQSVSSKINGQKLQ